MPYYDFACNLCQRPFEVKCSWSELDKVSCPHCESPNVQRIYTSIGILKGPAAGGGFSSMPADCAPGSPT